MKIARGVVVLMLVLGAAACSESALESNAPSAGSGTADVTATAPETTAAAQTTTVDEVESPDATTASSLLASGDIDVATTEPNDAMPVQEPSGDSIVVALNLDDGLPLWTAQPSDDLRGVTYPIGVDDRVIVQSAWCGNNLVAALDAATGEMLWRTDPALQVLEVNPRAASVVDEGGVVVAMTGQPQSVAVTGIDTSDGHVLWSTEPSPDRGFVVTESPSIVAGWSPQVGTLWVLDRGDGSTLWSIPVGEPMTAGNAPQMPFAAADDERLYVIVGEIMTTYTATTGEPLWSVTDPAWAFPPSPVAADSGVVMTGSQAGIVAYDAETGDELWRRDDPASAGSVSASWIADGNIYLNTGTGIAALEVTTGATRWDTSSGVPLSTVPGTTPTIMYGTDVAAAGNDRVVVSAGGGVQLLDAASGEVLWGPNPAPLATRFTTIGPDAVLIGNTCGGD